MKLPASNEIDAAYSVGETLVFSSFSLVESTGIRVGLPEYVIAARRTKTKAELFMQRVRTDDSFDGLTTQQLELLHADLRRRFPEAPLTDAAGLAVRTRWLSAIAGTYATCPGCGSDHAPHVAEMLAGGRCIWEDVDA